MKENYLRWSDESSDTTTAVEPLAGSWKTHYIQFNEEGNIYDNNGQKIPIHTKHPSTIDWARELKKTERTVNNLSDQEEQLATYWGTGVPTKQFIPIIDQLMDEFDVSPPRAARILAAVLAAINDAFIVCWYYKYHWDVARPNQHDPQLKTVIPTPSHPSYPSGHATIAGCVETVLAHFFPTKKHELRKLAEECAKSRLYAGVHFDVDNKEGLKIGRKVGQIAVNQLKREKDKNKQPIDKPLRKSKKDSIFSEENPAATKHQNQMKPKLFI